MGWYDTPNQFNPENRFIGDIEDGKSYPYDCYTKEESDDRYAQKSTETDLESLSDSISTINTNLDLLGVYVTPQMFGAKGDGVTSDTAAFLSMIASEHTCFVLPAGKYLIDSQVVIKSNCQIIGLGGSEIYLSGNGELHFEKTEYTKISDLTITVDNASEKSAISIKGMSNCIFQNVKIAAERFNASGFTGINVVMDSGFSFVFNNFINVEIKMCKFGIVLTGVNNGWGTSNTFTNVLINRFVDTAVKIDAARFYSNVFNNLIIDDSYSSTQNRTGVHFVHGYGNIFNNIIIWADARNLATTFYAFNASGLDSYNDTNVINKGYVEGLITGKGVFTYFKKDFFWQDVDSITNVISWQGHVEDHIESPNLVDFQHILRTHNYTCTGNTNETVTNESIGFGFYDEENPWSAEVPLVRSRTDETYEAILFIGTNVPWNYTAKVMQGDTILAEKTLEVTSSSPSAFYIRGITSVNNQDIKLVIESSIKGTVCTIYHITLKKNIFWFETPRLWLFKCDPPAKYTLDYFSVKVRVEDTSESYLIDDSRILPSMRYMITDGGTTSKYIASVHFDNGKPYLVANVAQNYTIRFYYT